MILPEPQYQEFCPEHGILSKKTSCLRHQGEHFDCLEWQSLMVETSIDIVCLHALGLSALAFSDLGSRLANCGYHAYALDLRGFGKRRSVKEYERVNFEECSRDVTRFLKVLKRKNPDRKTILLGESMGGALTLKIAAEEKELVDGVISSAPAWRLFKVPTITAKGLIDRITGQPGHATRWVIEHATTCDDLRKHWWNGGPTRLDLSIEEAVRYLNLMNTTPGNAGKIDKIPALIVQGLHDQLSKPWASAGVFKCLATPRKEFLIALNSEHVVFEENQLSDEMARFIENWIKTHFIEKIMESSDQPISTLGNQDHPLNHPGKLDKLIKHTGVPTSIKEAIL